MSKHTPGPWVAKASPESEHSDWIVSGPRLRVGISTDRSAADARLIAAAPELLGALRAAMPHLEAIARADNATYALARAALAKANGEGSRS